MSGLSGLAGDLRYFDGLEPVGLVSADGGEMWVIPRALRRKVSEREAAASDGKYTQADARWHWSVEEGELGAGPAVPAVGMTLWDANGGAWRLLEVERAALGTRWSCLARELAIAEGLTEWVTIERAVWWKGESGAVQAEWVVEHANVRARLQRQSGDVVEEKEQQGMRERVKIYLAEPMVVDGNHRVLHGGEAYRVLGYEMPDRLDRLFVIEAERMRWGS